MDSKHETSKLYMKENYEIKWFASNSLDLNRSPLGRIRNQFVKAIMDEILLLRLVLIITDADIINSVLYKDYGVSDTYGRIVHWLAAEFNKVVEIHKDHLPKRAV